MTEHMLSTASNPFNPFENFDAWLQYDIEKGYNCCGLLARIARTSTELSECDYNLEVDRAIDEIVMNIPLEDDYFIKVSKESS